MTRWALALAVALILAGPAPALAQAEVPSWSQEALIQALQEWGYTRVEPSSTSGFIGFTAEGHVILMVLHSDGDLQLYYVSPLPGTLAGVNEWNLAKRFSRAYIDADGDATLESDLLSNGGFTQEETKKFVELFVLSVGSFEEFLGGAVP